MGKGDGRRPTAVPEKVMANRWRRTFGGDMTCLICGSKFWNDLWSRCPKCFGEERNNWTERRRQENE